MKLNIWAPGPESRSGIAAYAAEQAESLAAHVDVARVSESEAEAPPDADLDFYHLGNSAEYGFIYRAALARPGVVLLHDWNLHRLVLSETIERGDTPTYLREMRRAHGEGGAFIAGQIARGRGGEAWLDLYPLNDAILRASVGIITLTTAERASAVLRVRDLPVHSIQSDRGETPRALADFLGGVLRDRERLAPAAASRRPVEGSLRARLLDEVRTAAHDLGLGGLSLGVEPLLGPVD